MPGELLAVRQLPDAFGGFCDVYEGTLASTVRVCIKRLRISIKGDREKVKEVFTRTTSAEPSYPNHFEAVLQRGRGVEMPQPPECCAFPGRHVRTPSTRFRVDAWRTAAGVHKGKSGYRPHQSCRSIFTNFDAMSHPSAQSLGIAEGLTYLHSREVIHGDLKGVRTIIDSGGLWLTEVILAKYHCR